MLCHVSDPSLGLIAFILNEQLTQDIHETSNRVNTNVDPECRLLDKLRAGYCFTVALKSEWNQAL